MSDIQIGVIGIGVVGVGSMGTAHAKMLAEGKIPGATLGAVCDIDPERLAAFPDVLGFPEAQAMYDSGKVDAVIVATPHPSHGPLGAAALRSGLHLLMEKPIAVHKVAAQELIDAHTDDSLVFSAMFNQRTDPRYRRLKRWIESGELGRINRMNWTITDWFRTELYYAAGDWRATWSGEGGGVLLNQCPHQLDLWQWLLGMPSRVRATCKLGRFHEIEVEDDVTAVLEYESGATGVFITTTGEAPGTNRLELACESGRVIVEGSTIVFDRNRTPTSEFCKTAEDRFARPKKDTETYTFEDTGEQHLGILKNFAAAIRNGEPLIAPAAEGIHSVELANAMLYSGLTDEPVDLPLEGDRYAATLQDLIDSSTFTKKRSVKGVASADDMSSSF